MRARGSGLFKGCGLALKLRPLAAVAPLFLILSAFGNTAAAQETPAGDRRPTEGQSVPLAIDPDSEPALISADDVRYDRDLGVVTARGNVEVSQGLRVLLADVVSYNQRSDVVTASGNVSLLEPTGEVISADFVELTGDLREGFIRDIRVLMSDDSRIAAASGLRVGGNRTIFRNGVFSPCAACRDDPNRAPLWQLKAGKVIHDQESRTISYSNAWMELFGVPVFYTPYFQHPDPTVERKSGFLAPTVGSSSQLGALLQVPYHYVVGPTADITFEPIATTKQGVVLAGEYRQLFTFGKHSFRASGTIADREADDGSTEQDQLRGHIDAQGRYDLSDSWRAGFDLKRSSDDTYLRLYDFDDDTFLTSRLFAEALNGRDYSGIQSIAYQGLRERDRNRESPIVAPLVDINLLSEPAFADSVVRLDFNALALNRLEGRDTRRASLKAGWYMPYTDPIGGLYKLEASVQADGYWTQDFVPGNDAVDPGPPTESTLAGRLFPQLALQWRYPWVSHGTLLDQVVEPVAQVVFGPNGSNPDEIPNEDSLDFEFDDTNLFSLNRFPGHDRVDPGSRLDYGLRWSGSGQKSGYAEVFVGQSYRLTRNQSVFDAGSGVREQLSDVVGRVLLRPLEDIDVLYRFRLDKNDFSPRRQEVDLLLGPEALRLDIGYLQVDDTAGSEQIGNREEISLRLDSQVTENWSGFVSGRRDILREELLRASVGLTYEDECFMVQIVGERSFFSDREIESSDSILVRFEFKHLGGFNAQ